jgi:MFS family permease
VFRDPAPRAVLAVTAAVGVAFGGIDVSTVAYARAHGLGTLSGAMLALFALGSGLSGLLFGARAARGGAPERRFLVAAGLMSVALWLPFAAPTVAAMVPLVLLTGATVSPTMISANAVMERLVAPEARTEGFGWLGVALGAGISAGAPLAGAMVDHHGARSGFAVVAAAGALIGLAALSGRQALLAARDGDRPATGDGGGGAAPAAARGLAVGDQA